MSTSECLLSKSLKCCRKVFWYIWLKYFFEKLLWRSLVFETLQAEGFQDQLDEGFRRTPAIQLFQEWAKLDIHLFYTKPPAAFSSEASRILIFGSFWSDASTILIFGCRSLKRVYFASNFDSNDIRLKCEYFLWPTKILVCSISYQ